MRSFGGSFFADGATDAFFRFLDRLQWLKTELKLKRLKTKRQGLNQWETAALLIDSVITSDREAPKFLANGNYFLLF
jgi:hypothetical protein